MEIGELLLENKALRVLRVCDCVAVFDTNFNRKHVAGENHSAEHKTVEKG